MYIKSDLQSAKSDSQSQKNLANHCQSDSQLSQKGFAFGDAIPPISSPV